MSDTHDDMLLEITDRALLSEEPRDLRCTDWRLIEN